MIRRWVLALCTGVLLTGLPATAQAAPLECSSPVRTTEVLLKYQDSFTYIFRVSWCVEGKQITGIATEVVHEQDGKTCTWTGRMEEWIRRDQLTGSWTAFDMSEFSCMKSDGSGTQAVNPWAMVTVYPDNTPPLRRDGIER
ncbi:hypothetical protein JOF56_010710 [Kibdelosporangium banguiense]|uniref:Uncharacterized protein n=1 Tax=Kibdelosporangium banguiense TaxID=1365924 RepID=A0ABS4U116_9PSEU|nr:hypothetical protein [Kibdelosporangium banguiense]MBP2330325.1 hypothetical protein [Kibdelosporangium banguiense]